MVIAEIGLITKVIPPRQRARLVHRPRLLALLEAGVDAEVKAVIAPPGYGKTTLLCQHLAVTNQQCCWLTLDNFDREPARLLRYLILAFDRCLSGLADRLLPSLDACGGAPQRIQDCLEYLITAVHQQGTSPLLLVLDDIHYLDDSLAARAVLAPLLQHLPECCSVILAGRKLPELPILHRLRAYRQLDLIEADSLAFTLDEAADLVQTLLGEGSTVEAPEHLVEQVEGWATGLALIVQATKRDRGQISVPKHQIFDFFCAEAYEALADEEQNVLLVASVLKTITPSLLGELLGEACGGDLENLQAQDLFLQQIDEGVPAYRFHQLYREFLQQRFRRTDLPRYRALHARAAALLSDAGAWQEAVEHCVEAEDWELACTVLLRAVPEVKAKGLWQGLLDTVLRLPEAIVEDRSDLLLLQAEAAERLGEIRRAADVMQRVLPRLLEKGHSLTFARALLLHGAVLYRQGSLDKALSQLERALTMLRELNGPAELLGEARRQIGVCAGMLGDFARANKELEESLSTFEALGNLSSQASVHRALGIVCAETGEVSAAITHFERASSFWRELGDLSGLAGALNNLATFYYIRGQREAAQKTYNEVLHTARLSGDQQFESYALIGLGRVAVADRQPDVAAGYFSAALDRAAARGGESALLTHARCGLAESQRQLHEYRRAEEILASALEELGSGGSRVERGLCLMGAGFVRRDEGDLREAVGLLSEAAGLFAHDHARREEAQACFVLAQVQFGVRQRRYAMRPLERVAQLVEELGSEQCILADAQQSPLMLQYAAARHVGNGLYARLVKRLLERSPESLAEEQSGKYPAVVSRALGPVEVSVGLRQVTDLEWRSSASKEMFLYLLTRQGKLRKEEIVDALWPELEPERYNSQFHSNVYRIRQAIYPQSVVQSNGTYGLNCEGSFQYDVETFQQLLSEGESHPQGSEQRAALFLDALRLYRGPFAEEFYSEWTAVLREKIDSCYLYMLTSLAGYHASRGEYQASIEISQKILATDPYHDAATIELMRSWAALGDVAEAQHVYRRFVQFLHEEHAGEPSMAMTRLYRQLSSELSAAAV